MGNYDNYPYGNGDFWHSRFHIGKVQSLTRSRIISVTIWGLTKKIPKWKWFPYGDPHRHIEIPVWKWAGRKKNYHLGNPNYRILSATIWVLMLIPISTAILFWYGDSPSGNMRVSLSISVWGFPILIWNLRSLEVYWRPWVTLSSTRFFVGRLDSPPSQCAIQYCSCAHIPTHL
jgi:hypothetical protein